MGTPVEDGWRRVYPNAATRTSTARHEEGAVTSLIELARPPDLAPQRERPPELDANDGPRLRAPSGVQHYPQGAVDAEPGVPEAGVAGGCSITVGTPPRPSARPSRRGRVPSAFLPTTATVHPATAVPLALTLGEILHAIRIARNIDR